MDVPLRVWPKLRAEPDATPSLIDQANDAGWDARFFHFGKAESPSTAYFNPGLVERPDGLWLLARRSIVHPSARWGLNSTCAFKLDDNKVPQHGKVLTYVGQEYDEHFDDPRGIYHAGHTWVSACCYLYYGSRWSGAHQTIGVFDADWQPYLRYHPEIGGNGPTLQSNTRMEKNWLWWFHQNRLHMLYQANPWQVYSFGSRWDEMVLHESPGITWPWGEIRGGTPPVLVGDRYYTFFHSSTEWRPPYRRYHMGVVAFEAKPPFKPIGWSTAPMLSGSANDRWDSRKPACVFPCGALMRDGKWLVTFGSNDLQAGWVEIPHEDVLRITEPTVDKPRIPRKRGRRIKRKHE